MDLAEIEAINARTLKRLREKAPDIEPARDLYFGFYTADIFECPSFVMFTAADCPRAEDILLRRCFEPTSMKVWCRLAGAASAILDVGAHVGVYSLAAAALRPDLPIHAFEPNPYAYARLRVHKNVNRFTNIIEHCLGLADRNGKGVISWIKRPNGLISSGSAFMSPDERCESAISEVKRLDDLPAAQVGPRGLLKIDVEGVEKAVFDGMPNVLAANPDIILESFDAGACAAIEAMIKPLGYRAYLIREHEGDLVPQERLSARAHTGNIDFNQFLTVRPGAEIDRLLA